MGTYFSASGGMFGYKRMIAWNLASVFGLPYEPTILVTAAVAALAMTVAIGAVVFFALAPHLPGTWATQFGFDRERVDEEPAD